MTHIPVTTAPFSYTDNGTPSGYVCGCGASGVRLYREYQTVLSHQVLRCRACARKQYTAAQLKQWAAYEHPNDPEHCIGGLVAAVPTEEGDTYWGFMSVPQAGVEWWDRLPKEPTGTWWCNTHGREATHVNAKGEHACPPHSGGIMFPCAAVFAPMTVTYPKQRAKRRADRVKSP